VKVHPLGDLLTALLPLLIGCFWEVEIGSAVGGSLGTLELHSGQG
jgi:hypothetical protein